MPSGAGTEHLVQPGEQGWLVEWLFDEVHTVVEDSLGAEQALGVARHEEHPDAGPVGPDLVGELLAWRPRAAHRRPRQAEWSHRSRARARRACPPCRQPGRWRAGSR